MESLKSFLYVSRNRNILTFQLKGLSFILGNGNHKELSIFHEVTFWSWKINKLTLKKFLIFLEMEHSSPKLKKFLSFLGKLLDLSVIVFSEVFIFQNWLFHTVSGVFIFDCISHITSFTPFYQLFHFCVDVREYYRF